MGVLIGSCGTATPADPSPSPTAGAAAEFPVTIGDLTLAERPTRIVVLAPTATEMLFAMGAGGQVVAVDDNSTYPAEAPRSDLSGFQPNAEAIASHEPDLVVISNDINQVKDQLGTLKIPVYLAGPAQTLDDTYTQLEDLGRLTGHGTEAADVVRRMKDDIGKILAGTPKRADKPTYYYELDQSLYSVTGDTFVGSLFDQVGLVNVADTVDPQQLNAGYPQLSVEFLIEADPDLIFLADTKCCGQSAETVRARPGWGAITAVRENRIVALDDDIASRWGPRVVELVRVIADAVGKTG
ncbi:iron complex transport system substrate-binding protein [Saccharothrix carnea]|uniref:Iron complex transport system substrate-binding protein n=1 Tax=Saccharothrix carnea TaxID=1280637 RepID=A0A2P8I0J6_SACCR|nr:ABC transporter substrate-binding protein [Saccharothrix carnea]PSL51996.1 iron complex transport system substrate-binding protein [Saccharothrix carnea]